MTRRLLFICDQNQNRSKTAEEIFRDRFETKSAGIFSIFLNPVTEELLKWAELIVVMELHQEKEIINRFPEICKTKQILCLNIPDNYYFMDENLIKILKKKFDLYLKKEKI